MFNIKDLFFNLRRSTCAFLKFIEFLSFKNSYLRIFLWKYRQLSLDEPKVAKILEKTKLQITSTEYFFVFAI